MDIPVLHPWTQDSEEAIRTQDRLSRKLVLAWDGRTVKTIGGIDVGYTGHSIFAAIAILSYPYLDVVNIVTSEAPPGLRYMPGLLAFRVAPAILAAWEKMPDPPDLLLIHGHGTAHPRRMGLASHLGLWLNLPSIGVAKSRLYGYHVMVGINKGDWRELVDENDPADIIGAVVRTRTNTRPIYISPGHLIDLRHSLEFVLACCHSYRLPEPIRVAHRAAAEAVQLMGGGKQDSSKPG